MCQLVVGFASVQLLQLVSLPWYTWLKVQGVGSEGISSPMQILLYRLILVMHIFMCVCAHACVHMSAGAHQSQKKASSDPGEPFDVGAKKSSM